MTRQPIVTVDGPAGSGKSTTAKEVARRLGFRHLDSGALYRALTFALLEEGVPEDRWEELDEGRLEGLGIRVDPDASGVAIVRGGRRLAEELRSSEVTQRVSRLSAVPAVRTWLLRRQREAARGGRVVADGRDMGTVVFPDADLKIFLVADLDERARRRLRERGEALDDESVGAEAFRLAERDRRDEERAVAPLRKPEGAVEIDTTGLAFEEQVDRIVELLGGGGRP